MTSIITIKEFLTKDECTELLTTCKNDLELTRGVVVGDGDLDKIRKSNVAFINDLGFLNERLRKTLVEYIKINGYNVSKLGPFQFTEYEVDGFYKWHSDSSKTEYKNRFYSCVIQINDEYVGGELEIKENKKEIVLERGLGNLFMFPSHLLHRVKPIISGTRYSLVNWVELEKKLEHKKELI